MELMEKNHVGDYSSTIDLKIAPQNNDKEEKILYKKALLFFGDARSEINKLGLFVDEDINLDRFLALMIKESRLDENAVSASKAI
ncbi:hypothetical protein KKG31_03730 [Patescibacteria group bacterium]|nr:hypothetical protein [Patescibacteria group bacterium]MBU1758255.1 hypothetical protein [Patescibacteria group bacterium]